MTVARSSYDLRDPFGGIDDPNKLLVEFIPRLVLDESASTADEPVYTSVDYVRVKHLSEKDEILQPAHDGHKRRFARQWTAYQEGKTLAPVGIALAALFPNNPEIVKNLQSENIFVVEQLAALSDTQIQNLGLGGRQFSDRAKSFLAARADERQKSQQTQIDEMAAEIAKLKRGKS